MLVWLCVWVKVQIAYGPADATATHYLLLQYIQIGFTFLVLPLWCWLTRLVLDWTKSKRAVKRLCVCVCTCWILHMLK